MMNLIDANRIMEKSENKEKQEIDALFDEILCIGKEKKRIAEEQWKKFPGEEFELELELDYQFWQAWPSAEILKNKLPLLWEAAVRKHKDFETENRWESAEEWEMSQDGQFDHLLEGIKKDFRQRLEKKL